MKSTLNAFMFAAAVLSSLVQPALIPDGDYLVIVEKIVDAKHIIVRMDNGIESQIPAAPTLSFNPAAHLKYAKIFVYKGAVITFKPV